jgi:hypothetical protein
MTTAEIAAELGPQGIARQSIASALGALVQAEKLSSQREGVNIFLPPLRYRPHPISRAHSSARKHMAIAQRRTSQGDV